MISFISTCFLAILDGFFGTPLQTCQALLAMILPGGFSIFDLNIFHRTDPGAYIAGIAFFIWR